jgi:isoleucyl-tRNA synthetase
MKEAAKKVNWHPKYVGRRMQNWLDSMEDWMISRKRFYGLALPFYECECGELVVIGSLEELKEKAVNPELIDGLKTLHRPFIDQIEINCPKCGQHVKRIPDVGDCWLDAGIVPFSTLKYLEDKTYWQKWFPADLVSEMIEQVRLWFYSMLFFSVTFENIPPYTDVVTYSEVRDEKGQRMSKTKKNGIPYDEAVSKMGADSMRWLYCQQKSFTSVNFGYTIADQVKRDFVLILWNSYRFFTQHANLDNWQPSKDFDPSNATNIMDKWLLSCLHSTILKTTESLEKFSTSSATKTIEQFVNDLSTWYIRRSRDRNDNNDLLLYCFHQLSLIISPFVPFLSEILYKNLSGLEIDSVESSVHLQNWPKFDKNIIDHNLEKQMESARGICQLIHGQRQKFALKLRQPLAKVTVDSNLKLDSELITVIAEETNVKEVVFDYKTDLLNVVLDTNLTPELISEGEYRDLIRAIQVLRREADLQINDQIKIFSPNWPKSIESQILKKTLGISIEKSEILKIEKA